MTIFFGTKDEFPVDGSETSSFLFTPTLFLLSSSTKMRTYP